MEGKGDTTISQKGSTEDWAKLWRKPEELSDGSHAEPCCGM